jgi:hypothetical protein
MTCAADTAAAAPDTAVDVAVSSATAPGILSMYFLHPTCIPYTYLRTQQPPLRPRLPPLPRPYHALHPPCLIPLPPCSLSSSLTLSLSCTHTHTHTQIQSLITPTQQSLHTAAALTCSCHALRYVSSQWSNKKATGGAGSFGSCQQGRSRRASCQGAPHDRQG